jgi:class 3 adenylate cyclase
MLSSGVADDFWQLVRQRAAANGEQREDLERAIWARWGRTCAVLVSDMARFSRITRDHGVLHFLAMIDRMAATCRPAIEGHGGQLIKGVADNLFATFPSVQQAVDAGVAMLAAARAEGRGRPDAEQIWLGIGIAHGLILELGGQEIFGDAVNIASKLGEDTANEGDILVTAEAAVQARPPDGFRFEARRTRISSMELDYQALIRA